MSPRFAYLYFMKDDPDRVRVTNSEQWPMRGRTVLVTGGTGGIGYQTARALAQRGARVLITGRQAQAGEQAAAAIRRQSGRELGQQCRRPVPDPLGDRRRL